MKMTKPGDGDAFFRMNGAGEMLVFSAADFEDFLEPRPDLAASLENELEGVVMALASNCWPFRLHATYDESISRFLDVFERVNREVPLQDLRWFLDHCETISDRNLERVKVLGGGIDRYGAKAAERTPPVRKMLEMGIPVGAGTDATRVANYNPFNSLYWMVSGRTVGGLELYPEANRMTREEALRLYTAGSAWFSGEDDVKGRIIPGQLADLVVTSDDYLAVPEEKIRDLQSVLTIVGGKTVYAAGPFREHDAPPIPVLPEWSPVARFGGYGAPQWDGRAMSPKAAPRSAPSPGPLWGTGCDCFAF
jgi:predicted amidohydrolase YtcJ